MSHLDMGRHMILRYTSLPDRYLYAIIDVATMFVSNIGRHALATITLYAFEVRIETSRLEAISEPTAATNV